MTDAIPRTNIEQIGGEDVAESGGLPVGGPAAHGERSTQNPVLGGAIATEDEQTGVAEGRLVQLSATLKGWLRSLVGVEYRADPTALVLADGGIAPLAADKAGHMIPRSGWRPLLGGGQRINIGVAAWSAQLVSRAEYLAIAKADCWIADTADNATPAVVGTSAFLPAYTPFAYVVDPAARYLAVITDAVTLANGLALFRVR